MVVVGVDVAVVVAVDEGELESVDVGDVVAVDVGVAVGARAVSVALTAASILAAASRVGVT